MFTNMASTEMLHVKFDVNCEKYKQVDPEYTVPQQVLITQHNFCCVKEDLHATIVACDLLRFSYDES